MLLSQNSTEIDAGDFAMIAVSLQQPPLPSAMSACLTTNYLQGEKKNPSLKARRIQMNPPSPPSKFSSLVSGNSPKLTAHWDSTGSIDRGLYNVSLCIGVLHSHTPTYETRVPGIDLRLPTGKGYNIGWWGNWLELPCTQDSLGEIMKPGWSALTLVT